MAGKAGQTYTARAGGKGGMTSGLLLAAAVGLLALPSAVLAFSSGFDPKQPAAPAPGAAQAEPVKLAGSMPLLSLAKGRLYGFTPAHTASRPDSSVTVAVRVDAAVAHAITVRGHRLAAAVPTPGSPQIGLGSTAFNLGMSRGFQNFKPLVAPATEAGTVEMPDLSKYQPGHETRPGSPRFSPRIVMDEKPAAGRAPRTFGGEGDDLVDVGGSYRLSRNLNVTAGVRYSQERERLRPLTDGKQDSQAVYVGTQFRF